MIGWAVEHASTDSRVSVLLSLPRSWQGDFDPIYDLVGVSNHMGSLSGGHYVAQCFNSEMQKWYGFNDENVSDASAVSTRMRSALRTVSCGHVGCTRMRVERACGLCELIRRSLTPPSRPSHLPPTPATRSRLISTPTPLTHRPFSSSNPLYQQSSLSSAGAYILFYVLRTS